MLRRLYKLLVFIPATLMLVLLFTPAFILTLILSIVVWVVNGDTLEDTLHSGIVNKCFEILFNTYERIMLHN